MIVTAKTALICDTYMLFIVGYGPLRYTFNRAIVYHLFNNARQNVCIGNCNLYKRMRKQITLT